MPGGSGLAALPALGGRAAAAAMAFSESQLKKMLAKVGGGLAPREALPSPPDAAGRRSAGTGCGGAAEGGVVF